MIASFLKQTSEAARSRKEDQACAAEAAYTQLTTDEAARSCARGA
jgi:hypothetical protein